MPDKDQAVTSNRPKPEVRIVHLTGPVLDSLARGDLAGATATSPVPLTAYLTGSDRRRLWQRRSRQVAADPGSASWVTGIIWDQHQLLAVGTAGYHGPPDTSGMVEIGYAVDPSYRRRGYARAALESLLARAVKEPQVRTVRVTISPGNSASYRLAAQYGFVKVGEDWDDEDGLGIIYEIPADRL
ncbi:GNAT family N-acetyltransferase [Amycolatopsis samaneae]|uniref:GNAT family N-acetyltransferase n=1 Tax=Amycolatopsis samaneae TaxID=664691 RepID=A0ABW5GAL9_9PSEU